jgi:H+/Cl- antiporter ClcA
MIAVKTNIGTGWKGGEIFPVMFASAAIGLGISNIIPGVHPMIAIATTMAATTTIVLDNIFLSLAIMLLFLPGNLFIFMIVASLIAFFINRKLQVSSIQITQKEK